MVPETKTGLSVRGLLSCPSKRVGKEQGNSYYLSSVQLLSPVRLFATPWTVACQASLSITNISGLSQRQSIEISCPLILSVDGASNQGPHILLSF